jgi:hypothetical protein
LVNLKKRASDVARKLVWQAGCKRKKRIIIDLMKHQSQTATQLYTKIYHLAQNNADRHQDIFLLVPVFSLKAVLKEICRAIHFFFRLPFRLLLTGILWVHFELERWVHWLYYDSAFDKAVACSRSAIFSSGQRHMS